MTIAPADLDAVKAMLRDAECKARRFEADDDEYELCKRCHVGEWECECFDEDAYAATVIEWFAAREAEAAHTAFLLKSAAEADRGDTIPITGLSREEKLAALLGDASAPTPQDDGSEGDQ